MFSSSKVSGSFAFLVAPVLVLAVLPARGQPASKPPVVPETVSPFEVIQEETSDKRTADAVVRRPPGKGPFPAVIYLHGGMMKSPILRAVTLPLTRIEESMAYGIREREHCFRC